MEGKEVEEGESEGCSRSRIAYQHEQVIVQESLITFFISLALWQNR